MSEDPLLTNSHKKHRGTKISPAEKSPARSTPRLILPASTLPIKHFLDRVSNNQRNKLLNVPVRELLQMKRAAAKAKAENHLELGAVQNNQSGEINLPGLSSSSFIQVTSPPSTTAKEPMEFYKEEETSVCHSEPPVKECRDISLNAQGSRRSKRKRRIPVKYLNTEEEVELLLPDSGETEDGVTDTESQAGETLNNEEDVNQKENQNEQHLHPSLKEVSVWFPSQLSPNQHEATKVPQLVTSNNQQATTTEQLVVPAKQQLTLFQQLKTRSQQQVTRTQQIVTPAQPQVASAQQLAIATQQLIMPVQQQVTGKQLDLPVQQLITTTQPQVIPAHQQTAPSTLYFQVQGRKSQLPLNQFLPQSNVQKSASFTQASSVPIQNRTVSTTGNSVLVQNGAVPVHNNPVSMVVQGTSIPVQGCSRPLPDNAGKVLSTEVGSPNSLFVINNQVYVMVPVVRKPPVNLSADPKTVVPSIPNTPGNNADCSKLVGSDPDPHNCCTVTRFSQPVASKEPRLRTATSPSTNTTNSPRKATVPRSSRKTKKASISRKEKNACTKSDSDSQIESDSGLSRGAVAEILGEVDNKVSGVKRLNSQCTAKDNSLVTINGKSFPLKSFLSEKRWRALGHLIKPTEETEELNIKQEMDDSAVVQSASPKNFNPISIAAPDRSERDMVQDILATASIMSNVKKSPEKRSLDWKTSHRALAEDILLQPNRKRQHSADAQKPNECFQMNDARATNFSAQRKGPVCPKESAVAVLQRTESFLPTDVQVKQEPIDTGYEERPGRNIFDVFSSPQLASTKPKGPAKEKLNYREGLGRLKGCPNNDVHSMNLASHHPVIETEIEVSPGELVQAFVHHIKEEVFVEDMDQSSSAENLLLADPVSSSNSGSAFWSGCVDRSEQSLDLPPIIKREPPDSSIDCSGITIEPASPVSDKRLNEMLLGFAAVSGSVEGQMIKQEPIDAEYSDALVDSSVTSTNPALANSEILEFTTQCITKKRVPIVKKKCLPRRVARRTRRDSQSTIRERKRKAYTCFCGKGFVCPAKLEDHQRVHTNEKPWKCPTCGKCFARRDVMIRHSSIHVNDRRFVCELCPKRFLYMYELSRHRRTHTGEKRFECHLCGKRLSQMSGLKRHLDSHKGDKPYPCNICKKSFVRKSVLVKHMGRRHKHLRALCPICGKGFRSKSAQIGHLGNHSGVKRNQCQVCKAQFSGRYWLQQHVCGRSQSKS